MSSIVLLAQALPSASSGVDWLYQFTNNLTNLTTQNGGALTQLGMTELACISFFMLVSMVVNWQTSTMTFRLHHHPIQAGDLTKFLLQLIICCLLETYWVNPFPGASFGINHFFSTSPRRWLRPSIRVLWTRSSPAQDCRRSDADAVVHRTSSDPLLLPCADSFGLASAILFLINCSAFILYGVTALFGPIFVPLLMTKTFRCEVLSLSRCADQLRHDSGRCRRLHLRVGGVHERLFIQQTFNGNYSMEMWLANLIPCTMVFIAFIINMLFIPSMTQAIFGGAGLTSGAVNTVGALSEEPPSKEQEARHVVLFAAFLCSGRATGGWRYMRAALLIVLMACVVVGFILSPCSLQSVQRKEGHHVQHHSSQ